MQGPIRRLWRLLALLLRGCMFVIAASTLLFLFIIAFTVKLEGIRWLGVAVVFVFGLFGVQLSPDPNDPGLQITFGVMFLVILLGVTLLAVVNLISPRPANKNNSEED